MTLLPDTVTVPFVGYEVIASVDDRSAPSGSVSFCSTGMLTDWPAVTDAVSLLADGGLFAAVVVGRFVVGAAVVVGLAVVTNGRVTVGAGVVGVVVAEVVGFSVVTGFAVVAGALVVEGCFVVVARVVDDLAGAS